MRYGHGTTHTKGPIDFKAIHDSKIEMFKRFMAAKEIAERNGNVVITPL
ncbi:MULTISPECIES: hypothetical protein [Yersinia]|nr:MULTISPECIES: hypothetical protein [Yersinia]MCB5302597.1 hypothetical protein [Yersinia bercovieri]MDN0103404.1 hypothetical protein [Yersinia bercovieri]CFQ31176.1 Uncharacterised protein [Yersinia bercovieri]CNI26804.1 Uncharacterised protein [Yersinia bercovieri]